MLTSQFLGPYVAANIVGLMLIVVAILWPKIARISFIVMFCAAAVVNAVLGVNDPGLYVTGYGELALFPIYRDFIRGFFSEHATAVIIAIACCQICIALLLTRSGWLFLMGVIGGGLFFLAITPLGAGSALPAPLLYGVGLFVLHRRLLRDTPHPAGNNGRGGVPHHRH